MQTLRRIRDAVRTKLFGKAGPYQAVLASLIALLVFGLPAWALAGNDCGTFEIGCYIALIFVKIFELLTALMGFIMIMEVDALLRVAQYANFVSPGPTAVQIGWVVTRDLANMFFIVFLLIIAFSTIIGVEKYGYRNNLRRLLIMAVVINFSKTICGIFIDMSQVMMLTFVNGFKEAAAGNFLSAFRIQALLNLAEGDYHPDFGLVLAMMMAFILSAIAVCVVLVMLVMMTFRIVMLWILIILSPIAFLTSSFPIGTNYYAQWWGELKKYLTSGPIIAFFLWLALASAQKSPDGLANENYGPNGGGFAKQSAASTAESAANSKIGTAQIPSEAGRADTILSLVIVTCIMFAGLKFASESGAAGSGFAGKMKAGVQNTLKKAAMAPVGMAGGALQSVGGRAMNRVGAGLARVPLLGGIGRKMAATGEKLEEGRRTELEKRWAGSAKDLAKYNPNQAGSKRQLFGASDGQIEEMAAASVANPKVRDAQIKSGADQVNRSRLEAIVAKDPSKKPALDAYNKATWEGIKDPEKQKGILAKMTGDEAVKNTRGTTFKPDGSVDKAGNLDVTNVARFSKAGAVGLMTSGNKAQTADTMAAFDEMARLGTLDNHMKEKGMTYADFPPEAFETAGARAGNLKAAALAKAEEDPALMKKFADNPLMRDIMAPVARTNLNAATTPLEKAQKIEVASVLGEAKDADFTPDVEQAMGQMSIKSINDMAKNTPSDSPEAQASLERVITAAMKHGSTELAAAIMKSPMLADRVPLTDAREAEKSTSGYTRSVGSAAGSSISDLDRQRKDAVAAGRPTNAPGGLDDQINDLRTAVKTVGAAVKDLATAEEHVVTLRENYGAAKKSGNTTSMQTIATALKAAISDANNKKRRVATENDHLKSLT